MLVSWAFSRPGLTKDGQPRSLQAHDGRWFALALVLGGIGAFAAAFFAARYEARQPLTEVLGREAFDFAIANHLAEHLPDPLRFLAECHALLRPHGA